MTQFGAATTITADVKLILLDCFETMVELDNGQYRPRLGMLEFLAHHGGRRSLPVVVVSDAEESQVIEALRQAGLDRSIVAIYHAGNAIERLDEGRVRKRLDVPVRDFALKPWQVVFIGDSPMDAEAAQFHGLRFIRVPRSEDRSFSFALLISGPSRYNSTEFSRTMLERYRPAGDPPR